jgi:hypothetical protein
VLSDPRFARRAAKRKTLYVIKNKTAGPVHYRPRRIRAPQMIDVLRIPVPKETLRAIPKAERALFLLLGYAANQINLFSKLVIFSSNKTPLEQPEQSLSGVQTQMLARILIGVLHETWELIRKRFLGTRLGKEYTPRLDANGQAALEQLKKNFVGSNILNKIRGNYAFHHPYDNDVDDAFLRAAADSNFDGDWNWFFSRHNYNSFYFMSDVVILHGILNAVGETDLVAAQKKVMGEVQHVSEDMTQFIMALTAAMWMKHFGPEMTGEICAKVDNAPDALGVWIPFFLEIPSEEPVASNQAAAPTDAASAKLSVARSALARSRARFS